MQKIVETGVATLLFVKVPKGATNIRIRFNKFLTYSNLYSSHIERFNDDWSDPMRVEDVTEEMAKQIVPSFLGIETISDGDYRDCTEYINGESALEEFQYILKANEIYMVNPFKYGRPSDLNHDMWYSLEQWQQAEENTGSWIMLIKQK